METPILAKYYTEHDPMKRKALLEQAIASGEEKEANTVRMELWKIRYQGVSQVDASTRADGFLGLWMAMEYNRGAAKKLFGAGSARKEIMKHMKRLRFQELLEKSALHKELLYKECCHLVRTYMKLCETDRSYNTTLFGIMNISGDKKEQKLKTDIYEMAMVLPKAVKLEEELRLITEAAVEVYEEFFPGEGGLKCVSE